MIRFLLILVTASSLFNASSNVYAAYVEKWASPIRSQYICDIGNTDSDQNLEILIGYTGSRDSLFLVDGATGAVEWSIGKQYIYVLSEDNPSSNPLLGPQLADVDGDGRDEIIFIGDLDGGSTRVFCFDSDGTVGVNEQLDPQSLPKAYGLEQNFPNPFNPATTIEYTVNQKSHVTLTIYNILGQAVEVLVDEERNPGTYSVHWNGKDKDGTELSTGVYFYTLKTERGEDSKKMLLLK